MDRWLIYLHVLSAFLFFLMHGTSAVVAFRVRGEKNLDRIRALLELSAGSYNLMYASLLALLITGIIAGFVRDAWGRGWIWASLGVLIVTAVLMFYRGSLALAKLRKAVGLEWFNGKGAQPAGPPASAEQIAALLKSRRAEEIAVIGVTGLGVILWLMMFRPF